MPETFQPKRIPVDYLFTALNWRFIRLMAEIASYADEKYQRVDNYTDGELVGDRAPLNHLIEHYQQYITGEPYDHFDQDRAYHLAAIAYNAMMEFHYYIRRGGQPRPCTINQPEGLPPFGA